MRNFGVLKSRFWQSELAIFCSENEERLALILSTYIVSCPQGNSVGIFKLNKRQVMLDIGCAKDELEHALDVLRRFGFIETDPDSRLVWVPEMLGIQISEEPSPKDNRMKLVKTTLRELKEHRFVDKLFERYPALSFLREKNLNLDASETTTQAPSKGLPSPLEGTGMVGYGTSSKIENESPEPESPERARMDRFGELLGIIRGDPARRGMNQVSDYPELPTLERKISEALGIRPKPGCDRGLIHPTHEHLTEILATFTGDEIQTALTMIGASDFAKGLGSARSVSAEVIVRALNQRKTVDENDKLKIGR